MRENIKFFVVKVLKIYILQGFNINKMQIECFKNCVLESLTFGIRK